MTALPLKPTLVVIAAILFAASPFFSGEFGGFDPNRFPIPQDNPPGQPAGYAFGIWGLIYLWLIAHAVYGLLKRPHNAGWDATRAPLLVSLAVGTGWIAVAQQSPLGALVLIWVMLISALMALFAAPRAKPLWLNTPLAIYAGWLTAASFVALAINGAGYGIGFDALGWAWIAVAALFVMAAAVQWKIGFVPGYGLTVAWALVAVGVNNLSGQVTLALVAFVGAAAFAALPFLLRQRH
jgi:hypothetical protein